MARRKKKEFYNVLTLFALLLIILSFPKQFWTNLFFIILILIEITLLLIFSYFGIQKLISKNKDICTDIEEIDKMGGIEFEDYVKELYVKLGYNARKTPINDYGADVIATKNSVKYCIQAKRYNIKYKVGVKAVQEVVSSINYYNANKGIVITNSNFTSNAIKLADKNGIILINRKKIQLLIKSASLSTNIKLKKFIDFVSEP